MSSRLRYLLYRCSNCGRLLTCLEIVGKWETAERTGSGDASLCRCGSRRVNPTNPLWWEELQPRVLKTWALEVAKPWIAAKFA